MQDPHSAIIKWLEHAQPAPITAPPPPVTVPTEPDVFPDDALLFCWKKHVAAFFTNRQEAVIAIAAEFNNLHLRLPCSVDHIQALLEAYETRYRTVLFDMHRLNIKCFSSDPPAIRNIALAKYDLFYDVHAVIGRYVRKSVTYTSSAEARNAASLPVPLRSPDTTVLPCFMHVHPPAPPPSRCHTDEADEAGEGWELNDLLKTDLKVYPGWRKYLVPR